MTAPTPPDDPYSRVAYRRLVAWERRIAREGPFLLHLLDEAPARSVLDLGCGTGEHVAFFAKQGARAVGVDRSEAMILKARDHEAAGDARFVRGDLSELSSALGASPPFGMAVCIGNVLPHLQDEAELGALFADLRDRLLPGGVLLLQVLNYDRIRAQDLRHLPVNVRPGDGDEEIVFLRLLKPLDEHRYLFYPTTIELHPDSEDPVRVHHSKRLVLRAWTADELVALLDAAGFRVELHGEVGEGPYEPDASPDVVAVARR